MVDAWRRHRSVIARSRFVRIRRRRNRRVEVKVQLDGARRFPEGDVPIFFGNLAWETTEETLTSHAATFGMTVVQCEVARQSGGRSKGWALVDFATPEEAQNAIEQMHNSEIGADPSSCASSVRARVKRARALDSSGELSGLQIIVQLAVDDDERGPSSSVPTSRQRRQRRRRVPRRYGPLQGLGYRALRDPRASASGDQGFNGVELEHRPMQIKIDRYD